MDNQRTDLLQFEDLNVGDRWVSPRRVVDEQCVREFAELTGDNDRLHLDQAHAQQSLFRKPIAHGLLGLSIMAGLSSEHPRVDTIAFTQIGEWQFKRPIFWGDTVYAESEVVHKSRHGRRAGKVVWYRQLYNQAGLVVQQGSLETIVAAQPKQTRGLKATPDDTPAEVSVRRAR